MLRAEQSLTAGASELDAPPGVPGVNSVEKTRMRTTPVEATQDYMEVHSPDANTLSYLPPLLHGSTPLHSPLPSHDRPGNQYVVRARFAKLRTNKLIHE